jgi:hypothetical protein
VKPVKIPLDQLNEDPQNARVHPERNLAAIEASLARFGQQKPIVVAKDGTVVAGNGTLAAARRLGWDALLCVQTDLPPDEARAFAIADNKTAELAEWDYQGLAETLRAMPEELRGGTGFADFEIEPLLQAEWTPPQVAELPEHSYDPVHSVHFGEPEWERVEPAVARVRQRGGLSEISTPAAISIICEEWLGR